MKEYPKDFLDLLSSVHGKRAKVVINHILQHGSVTTADLQNIYGYDHPPRAIRDVREQGIPLDREMIIIDGKKVARYTFGDPSKATKTDKKSGRTTLSKALKDALIEKYGSKCNIYLEEMNPADLQIDHRIPYEIAGEQDTSDFDAFMLLSPSANRAKSWTCEHCSNWSLKEPSYCMTCFWAYPEDYTHVSDRQERIITLVYTGNEIKDYEALIELAGPEDASQKIKKILNKYLKKHGY